MLTIDDIKTKFGYNEARFGNSAFYHIMDPFDGQGDFCDIYISSDNKEIKQEQVDRYNLFRSNYKKYLNEIESYIEGTLRWTEIRDSEQIKQIPLTFCVVEIPFEVKNFDFVLVCSKIYTKWLIFKKDIGVRIEFKNGLIHSIERKHNVIEENK